MSEHEDKTQARNYLWMNDRLRTIAGSARLLVIGCGGNGVAFTVNAAHIGFRDFILCDPDVLSDTNLNRFIIALPSQIGIPKVEIISAYLVARFPGIRVSCINQHFPNTQILRVLPTASLVVGCLDNQITRIHLDVLCRKYERTLIDLGTGFAVQLADEGSRVVAGAGGQVFVSRSHQACLRCLGFDLVSLSNNNYFIIDDAPEASSILINNIVSALAVECALNEMSHQLAPVNSIEYDRSSLSIRTEVVLGKEECQICGVNSAAHLLSVAEKRELLEALMKKGLLCKTV